MEVYVSDKTEEGLATLKQKLSILPEPLLRTILNRIRQYIHYESVICIMGKQGVEKVRSATLSFSRPSARSATYRKNSALSPEFGGTQPDAGRSVWCR